MAKKATSPRVEPPIATLISCQAVKLLSNIYLSTHRSGLFPTLVRELLFLFSLGNSAKVLFLFTVTGSSSLW